MFVLKSTHQDLVNNFSTVVVEYDRIMRKYNNLIDRINKKGGEEFLQLDPIKNQFDAGEINTLIALCHPDKHGGKKSATEITKKLLSLKVGR